MKLDTWLGYALVSAFFAGLTAVFAKVGVAQMSSNFATFLRTCVILVLTAAVVAVRGEWTGLNSTTARGWVFLILSALATGISWLFYYRALQLAPASVVAPIDKLSIVVAIGLGVLFLGEPMGWKLFSGAALMVIGAVLIASA